MHPRGFVIPLAVEGKPFLLDGDIQSGKSEKALSLLSELPRPSGPPHLFEARLALPELLTDSAHLLSSFSGMPHSPEIDTSLSPLPEFFPVIFDGLYGSKNNICVPKIFIGHSRIPSLSCFLLQSIDLFPHPFQLLKLLCHRSPLFRPRRA